MRDRWVIIALTLALACLPLGPAAAQNKPIELKFSSWVSHRPRPSHGRDGAVGQDDRGEERRPAQDHHLSRAAPSASPPTTTTWSRTGSPTWAFTDPGYTPGRFPLITATELPLGLFKSSRGGSLAVMSIFDKHFKNEFKDVKVLWFWVHPPGHFHLAKKQVKVLEDLNGLKIRAATPMLTTMVKTLGAIPVSIPAPDTYTALERGTVDGTIFPWEAISSFKIAEVLKYHVAVRPLRRPAVHVHEPEEVRQPPSRPAQGHRRSLRHLGRRVQRQGLGPERARRDRGDQEGGRRPSTPCRPRSASAGWPSSSRSRRSG